MEGPASCRVCSGALRPFLPGAAGTDVARGSFAPTCHAPGAHGDLFRCYECGTVEQPALPRGEALLDAYRHMDDDAYLAEEAGRRRTAGRLLDLVGEQVPEGRLLEVGCGHG